VRPRRLDFPAKVHSDESRCSELKRLVEIYAIRTRELSEVVARLGSDIAAGRRFEETIVEIKKFHVLCERAGEDLFAMIEPPEANQASNAEGETTPTSEPPTG
jgi:hypothetical protein